MLTIYGEIEILVFLKKYFSKILLIMVLVAIAVLFFCGCGEKEESGTNSKSVKKDPLVANEKVAEVSEQLPNVPSVLVSDKKSEKVVPKFDSIMSSPKVVRYRTPGMVRHINEFDVPVESIQWSSNAGLSLSAGKYYHNISTKGEYRWKIVAGLKHKGFNVNGVEYLWSSQFNSLFEVKHGGRKGWNRQLSGVVEQGDSEHLYMIDASTVAEIATDGSEKWRINIDGMRKIERPFTCEGMSLFEGKRSQKRVAVTVSDRGGIIKETPLPVNSVLLGTSFECEPIVWSDNEIILINSRNAFEWHHHFRSKPLFIKQKNGYLLIVPQPREPIMIVQLDKKGKVLWSKSLPIYGRVTTANIYGDSGGYQLIGLCKDVSSPCARSDSGRGPFNVVLSGTNGDFNVLQRVVKGNIGITSIESAGFIIASSHLENSTDMNFRDLNGDLVWETTLPGRLRAGPFGGPYEGVYVATCNKWSCEKPYRFIAVTAKTQK